VSVANAAPGVDLVRVRGQHVAEELALGGMSIEVHGLVAKSTSREYIEAVLADALKVLPSYAHRQDTLVVVNARRIAAILDKQAHRGAVIPVDLIEQAVSGTMKARLQAYLASPTQMLYVMYIAGSWFLPNGGSTDPR
jgi:hypothetical protein